MTNIKRMLANMGMSTRLIGFELCADAIQMAVQEPNVVRSMMDGLYPKIAVKHGISAARAERNIRTAIEVLYDTADLDQIQMYTVIPCSYKTGKAKNSEFISSMANYIVELGVEQ